MFMQPTWYNNGTTTLKDKTGWTDAQVTEFYNWNNTASFGYYLKESQAYNYDKYMCPSAMET
jgi:hypothetical protein